MSKQLEIWEDPAKEIGEVLLDEALDDLSPVLAKVPLLSTVQAAVKSSKAWSDYLLARKVQQFYSAWEILNKAERKSTYEKFQKRPRDFIEKLLFILEKQEDAMKCRTIGVLTVDYLRGKIRRGDYYDLIESMTQLTVSDLQTLAKLLTLESVIIPASKINERHVNTFIARGLMTTERRLPREQRQGSRPDYKLTKLGTLLAGAVR
jgi:hypothetical protein